VRRFPNSVDLHYENKWVFAVKNAWKHETQKTAELFMKSPTFFLYSIEHFSHNEYNNILNINFERFFQYGFNETE